MLQHLTPDSQSERDVAEMELPRAAIPGSQMFINRLTGNGSLVSSMSIRPKVNFPRDLPGSQISTNRVTGSTLPAREIPDSEMSGSDITNDESSARVNHDKNSSTGEKSETPSGVDDRRLEPLPDSGETHATVESNSNKINGDTLPWLIPGRIVSEKLLE
jgi:hypothetical protein